MENFNEIKTKIIAHLNNVEYDDNLLFYSDLSDIGNEIGIVISKYIKKRKVGYTIEDLIHGIKHGISLMNDTHPTVQ